MLKSLARIILTLLGWRLLDPPQRPARAVVVGYPHTSNWDALYAQLGKLALGLDAHWVGKDNLFRWPFAGILRWLGGIPVDRRAPHGFVDQMAAQFAAQPDFLLVMAPEGTRRLTEGWKSGFYRIALAAGVPLILTTVDYARREVGILAYLEPSGDPEADIAAIAAHYAGRQGRNPALASPIRWLG
ncbi:MAG: lysophospholipid acyltransferase family protein [Sulfuritalea sp.]|nr:lysophospholipid acyltransferase family protein [Sulfuritalea sp.]